jgi:signal transduction histidine kinase
MEWPLRLVILVPFLCLILFAVGLTGWLSYRTGQNAADKFITVLRNEITNNIQSRLENILNTLVNITEKNKTGIRLGRLKLDDLSRWRLHLLDQIQLFDSVSTIAFGSERGTAVWISREESGNLLLAIKEAPTDSATERTILESGELSGKPIKGIFDPRKRPWYYKPVNADSSRWVEIYPWYLRGKISAAGGLSYSQPCYDSTGSLQGVVSAEFSIQKLNNLMKLTQYSVSGRIFIMERSGLLVATSSRDSLYRVVSVGDSVHVNRIRASESQDPWVNRAATKWFADYAEKVQSNKVILFPFEYENQQQFVQVAPFQDSPFDWLIVSVLPASEFMKDFDINTRNTILLSLAALLLVIVAGVFISNRIASPIHETSKVAEQIAGGKLDQKLTIKWPKEISELAISFTNMAEQLKTSFTNIETKNSELESLNNRMKALVKFGSQLGSKIPHGETKILEFIHEQAKQFMDTANMYIAVYHDDNTEMISFPIAFKDNKPISVESREFNEEERGRTEEIILTGKPILILTRKESEEWYKQRGRKEHIGDPLASWIGVPMKIGERVIGVVATYHPTQDYVYNRDDLEILQMMADLAAIALENARLYNEARIEVIAAKQLSTLGTAIAALEHRINNTFSIVIPNLKRLRSRVNLQDEDTSGIFEIIDRNVRSTSAIIARILEPLREIEDQNVDINALLEEVVNEEKGKRQMDSVRINLTLDDSLPHIKAPIGQITEIFSNLIDNAYNSMQERGGLVSVTSFMTEDKICIRVQDTGSGILPNVQERLFKKPVLSKDPNKIGGLGLWLCQLMLKRVGGNIKIEKSDSNGTSMLVQISWSSAVKEV